MHVHIPVFLLYVRASYIFTYSCYVYLHSHFLHNTLQPFTMILLSTCVHTSHSSYRYVCRHHKMITYIILFPSWHYSNHVTIIPGFCTIKPLQMSTTYPVKSNVYSEIIRSILRRTLFQAFSRRPFLNNTYWPGRYHQVFNLLWRQSVGYTPSDITRVTVLVYVTHLKTLYSNHATPRL